VPKVTVGLIDAWNRLMASTTFPSALNLFPVDLGCSLRLVPASDPPVAPLSLLDSSSSARLCSVVATVSKLSLLSPAMIYYLFRPASTKKLA